MPLIPVEGNPFAGNLIPVDHQPDFGDPIVPPPANPALPPDAISNWVRNTAHQFGGGVIKGVGDVWNAATSPFQQLVAGAQQSRPGDPQSLAPMIEPSADIAMTLAGGGAGMAEKGAAGIFGGRLAAENLAKAGIDQPKMALKVAEHMVAQGATKEDIYAVTNRMLMGTDYAGVHAGADGKLRFEIPDNEAATPFGMRDMPLPTVMLHPHLYEAYPEMNNVNLSSRVPGGARGVTWSPTEIGVTREAAQSPSTPLHEVQHLIQEHEGFAEGSNPNDMFQYAARAMHELGATQDGNTARNAAMEAYRRHAGEVEARNVQTRLNMTPEQRRASAPWTTEDVPREQQIVRGVQLIPVEHNPFLE